MPVSDQLALEGGEEEEKKMTNRDKMMKKEITPKQKSH